MIWRGRRVFVTGATGMVGSSLVKDLLASGAFVVALIRDQNPHSELFRSGSIRRVTVVSGCLEDFWTLERALAENEVDTVFHLGAQAIVTVANRSPLQTFEANIRGTYNLLEACRMHQQLVDRIVIASSDKAYGEPAELPYREEMPIHGRHPYDVSKSCADLIAQAYHATYDLPLAVARCGNVYGAGDLNWSRIVPGTIRSLCAGERPIVRSDGTFVRDYIHVDDVSRAYMVLAQRLTEPTVRGQAFNFSPQRPVTVLELISCIRRLMGCEHLEPEIQNSARAEIRAQYLSAAKAQRLLNWRAQLTLDDGIGRTISWYRQLLADHESGFELAS